MAPKVNFVKNGLILALLAITSLQAAPVRAGNYDVNLTRKGRNIYKVLGKDVIIHTRWCYVYAYSEDAILKSSGNGGEVIFLNSKDKCDVKAVFGKSTQNPGKYVVEVSQESDDWYEVWGTGLYIRTSACISLGIRDEAYLTVSPSGDGELQFKDGDNCMVDGVYTKLRL